MIRQSVLKLAPLLGRIRQIKFGSLADWLKQDPIRDYRPWYRYSRPGKDADRAGRPNFEQTLAKALESNRSASLSAPAREDGPATARCTDISENIHKIRKNGNAIGAIDPVERSGRT
jgi:hypothetical protein